MTSAPRLAEPPHWLKAWAWGLVLLVAWAFLFRQHALALLQRLGLQLGMPLHPIPFAGVSWVVRGLPLVFGAACVGLLFGSRLSALAAGWLGVLIGLLGLVEAVRDWALHHQNVPWAAVVYLGFGVAVLRWHQVRMFTASATVLPE